MTQAAPSEAELHRLVDGLADPVEAARLERRLRGDRALQDRVALWRRQNVALQAAFEPIAQEPLPIEFLFRQAEAWPLRRAAAFAAGLLLGLVTGFAAGVALVGLSLP